MSNPLPDVKAVELVERLESITDGATELHDKHGSVIGYDVHLGNIEDTCDEAASELSRLRAEVERLKGELRGHDIAMANERKRWREHPFMQRLDAVRQTIAGRDPAEASWIATMQSQFMDAERRAETAEASLSALRKEAAEVATYLDGLGDNLLRNDADMLLDDCEDPKAVAERLRAKLTGEKSNEA